jgi:hypothetical protein
LVLFVLKGGTVDIRKKFYFYKYKMNFEALGWLASAPSKKYVRKLLEYAYLFRNKLHAFQEYMETPVSSSMS